MLSGVVGLAGLIAAVVVVVRTAKHVRPGPAPVTLAPLPKDTLGLKLRYNLRTRVATQERRLAKYRPLAQRAGPKQESLALECESLLAGLARGVAQFDSLPNYHARRTLYDSLMSHYEELRSRIRRLIRSVDSSVSEQDDSLEVELRRLLSE